MRIGLIRSYGLGCSQGDLIRSIVKVEVNEDLDEGFGYVVGGKEDMLRVLERRIRKNLVIDQKDFR